jgi:hypothetical protein
MPSVHPSKLVGDSFEDWFYSNHTAVWGITDSGKSTFVKRVAHDADHFVLYWNPEEESVPGRRARSAAKVRELFANGVKKVHYVPRSGETEGFQEEFERLLGTVWEIGDQLKGRGDKAPHWCLFVIDEAQTVAPQNGAAPQVNTLLRRGRKRGIHAILSAQRPADVDKTSVSQCHYHALFRMSTFELDYLRRHGVHVEGVEGDEADAYEWLQNEYHFIVTDGDRWSRFQPVEPI